MKRKTLIPVISLAAGIVIGGLGSGLIRPMQEAQADVPRDVWTKHYTPAFHEWAALCLRSQLGCEWDSMGFVGVGTELGTEGGLRFKITIAHAPTESGRQFALGQEKVARAAVNMWTKVWTDLGYPVEPTDFDIELRVMQQPPGMGF